AVDQERGADLYHHAAEVGEGGGATGHVEALAADRRHATTIVAPVRCLACAFGSAPRRNVTSADATLWQRHSGAPGAAFCRSRSTARVTRRARRRRSPLKGRAASFWRRV